MRLTVAGAGLLLALTGCGGDQAGLTGDDVEARLREFLGRDRTELDCSGAGAQWRCKAPRNGRVSLVYAVTLDADEKITVVMPIGGVSE